MASDDQIAALGMLSAHMSLYYIPSPRSFSILAAWGWRAHSSAPPAPLPCRRDIVMGAPVLLLILTACQPGASQAPSISQTTTTAPAARSACEVRNFEATVLQGKNAGLTLQGTLILQADAAGRLTTRLTPKTGNATRGSGQVNGRAINLFFDLGAGKNIFGTGTLDHDFAECKGVLGGTFAGPDRADTGTWGCSCCPCYIRTISPTLGLAPLRPFRAAPAAEQLRAGEFAVIKGNLVPAPRVPAP